VEYLFYSDPLDVNETSHILSIDTILEMGFPAPSEYSVCKERKDEERREEEQERY
jgi:hypothetical protein